MKNDPVGADYVCPLAISEIICYKWGAPAGGFAAQIIKRKNFLRAPLLFRKLYVIIISILIPRFIRNG